MPVVMTSLQRSWLVPSLLTCLVACGGSSTDEDATALPEVQPNICDGSDDVRFVASNGIGPFALSDTFAAELAGSFVSIDGQCNFWLYDATLEGLRTGVLDTDFANQLSSELQFGRYADLEYRRRVCRDSSGGRLWDGTGVINSTCGASGTTGLAGIVKRVDRLRGELATRSERAWRATHILPLSDPPQSRARPALEWTSTLDLSALAHDYLDYTNVPSVVGTRIEDTSTLALLAALRDATLDAMASASASAASDFAFPGLYVADARSREFRILLRDEPPEAVADAVRFAWSQQ
jgi:hypothetical protein